MGRLSTGLNAFPDKVIKKNLIARKAILFNATRLQVTKGLIRLPIGYNKDIFQTHYLPFFALNPQLYEIAKKWICNS